MHRRVAATLPNCGQWSHRPPGQPRLACSNSSVVPSAPRSLSAFAPPTAEQANSVGPLESSGRPTLYVVPLPADFRRHWALALELVPDKPGQPVRLRPPAHHRPTHRTVPPHHAADGNDRPQPDGRHHHPLADDRRREPGRGIMTFARSLGVFGIIVRKLASYRGSPESSN